MLVLSRKVGEKIRVGDDIFFTIVKIGSGVVRVGIDAPKSVPVVRTELDEISDQVPRKRKAPVHKMSRPHASSGLPAKHKR